MGNIRANSQEWMGKRFGNLIVMGFEYKSSRWFWKCKCDCGKETVVYPNQVIRGKTTTCGCGRSKTFHNMHLKHGCSGERLYSIWKGMRKRCRNENASHYEHYGERGISVCDEWNDYLVFRQWALANGYNDGLTIERKSVNKDYCPENCTWIAAEHQPENTRKTIRLTIYGKEKPIGQWADQFGIKRSTVYSRIRRGASPEKALGLDK